MIRKMSPQFIIKMLVAGVLIGFQPVPHALNPKNEDSLIPYLEAASKNNPVLLQKFSEYEAALKKVPQVGSLPDPELTLGVFTSPMELVNGKQTADIRLMQMFPWFGTLKAATDEMSLMAKARLESLTDAKHDLFYEMERTWFELYRIHQEIRVTERSIQILKSLENLSLVRFRTSGGNGSAVPGPSTPERSDAGNSGASSGMSGMGGEGSQESSGGSPGESMQGGMGGSVQGGGLADLYRIQIERRDLENNIEMIRNEQKAVLARFNSYLNQPSEKEIFLPESHEPDVQDDNLAGVSEKMLAHHPMLKMLQYEEESLEARLKMVKKMGYPMLGVGLDYSVINKSPMSESSMNGKDMIMPMVAVTLPVYRTKYKAMQAEVNLLIEAKKKEYQAQVNALQVELADAIKLYKDSGLKIKLYSGQVDLAIKTLQIYLKSYSTAGANLSDILRLRQQMLDYEFKRIEALADYHTSLAWLKRLCAHEEAS